MRWKRDGFGQKQDVAAPRVTTADRASTAVDEAAPANLRLDELRAGLEMRGFPKEFAETLAKRLESVVVEHGNASTEALLDGAVATFRLQAEAAEGLESQLGELRELERILGAFAGELSKLDETLEVLAAYARRMRTSAEAPPPSLPAGKRLH